VLPSVLLPHPTIAAATANAHVTSSDRPKTTVFNIVQRPHVLQFIQKRRLPSTADENGWIRRYLSITTASFIAVEATPLS